MISENLESESNFLDAFMRAFKLQLLLSDSLNDCEIFAWLKLLFNSTLTLLNSLAYWFILSQDIHSFICICSRFIVLIFLPVKSHDTRMPIITFEKFHFTPNWSFIWIRASRPSHNRNAPSSFCILLHNNLLQTIRYNTKRMTFWHQ